MGESATDDKTSDGQGRINDRFVFIAALLIAAFSALFYASLATDVTSGAVPSWSVNWVPQLGVALSFRIDALALLFALLISGIGVLIIAYTHAYMAGHRDRSRLQILLVLFMLSMLGLVSADNVIVLFVFWELTTITSYLLVGFNHEDPSARRSAMQALLVTGAGALALLVGLVMLAEAAGSYQLGDIVAAGDTLKAHPHYGVILFLMLAGAFTKSAQFPFHFWLPNAMAAPTPVSAYLHSATMVKAGLYLLARLQPALGGTDEWFYTLTIFGAVTAVWSSMMALRQTDMKLMLAWTTVMALGTITVFLASDSPYAAYAAFTFLLVHAFYKCSLFLVVGNVDHGTGTRDLRRLGSLAKAMPITALIALGAAFSMAGFPPFLGFIGKELMYKGALAVADEPWLVATASLLANAMMVSVGLIVVFRVFLGGKRDTPHEPHEASPLMWFGPLLLAVGGLVFGIWPEVTVGRLIEPTVVSVLREPTPYTLALWHGINLPLMMSVVTVALGVLMFWKAQYVFDKFEALVNALPLTGDTGYERSLQRLHSASWRLTDKLQSGSLSRYLTVVFGVFVVSMLVTLLSVDIDVDTAMLSRVDALTALVTMIMAVAAVVVAFSVSRLLSIAALGVVGSGLALVFLIYSAIDVAITQLMVETLFVVLISIVILRLPAFSGDDHPGTGGRWRDGFLAIGSGVCIFVITLGVATTPVDQTLTTFFAENSLTKAYGANIVNVILVDFRAMDTLGEVLVVMAASLAVIGLLKVKPRSPSSNAPT